MSKFEDDERFDGLYLNVANTTRGMFSSCNARCCSLYHFMPGPNPFCWSSFLMNEGIEPLLDTVFSFLRRKTDFFDGPGGSGGDAAFRMVNAVYQKHAKRYHADKAKSKKKSSLSPTKAPSPSKKATEKPNENDGVVEMGTDGGFDISNKTPTKATTTPSDSTSTKTEKTENPNKQQPETKASDDEKNDDPTNNDDDKDGDDDDTPPLGNGGTVTDKYVWTQTLEEVAVNIPVPDNTRGRDLNVTISRNHLKVGLRSQPKTWIVNDNLTKTVKVDDSFWTVEDGNRLVVNLTKVHQMEWWDSVCASDPKIDVKKIQPESSKLGDLDGETRKTVGKCLSEKDFEHGLFHNCLTLPVFQNIIVKIEKMMFDQRQKALGLPSSDDQQKMDALERIKKQHPELDFSQAKFS